MFIPNVLTSFDIVRTILQKIARCLEECEIVPGVERQTEEDRTERRRTGGRLSIGIVARMTSENCEMQIEDTTPRAKRRRPFLDVVLRIRDEDMIRPVHHLSIKRDPRRNNDKFLNRMSRL